MEARADAGEAGADDEDVEMFVLLCNFHGLINAQADGKSTGRQYPPVSQAGAGLTLISLKCSRACFGAKWC
jgi:hypothetical protein